MLLILGITAAGVWSLLNRLLRGRWPWDVGGLDYTSNGFQTTQAVLTVVGGFGAAVALVVAYRRQRDLEQARFDDRFAAAAQLGAATAAERLAGVYAMAALADQWEQHRQQCIDVLCAYLRLPYDPESGLLKAVEAERTWFVNDRAERREKRIYEQLPNDREVRHTIINVIAAHLRDNTAYFRADTPASWQGHNFDFRGAVFDGGSFNRAVFAGRYVDFRGAVFSGGTVGFVGAKFYGGTVNFGGAVFSSGVVDFFQAEFSGGGRVTFNGAVFSGTVKFAQAEFSDSWVDFGGAVFSGGVVDFAQAKFSGGTVSFEKAKFNGGTVTFLHAKFSGSTLHFLQAKFFHGTVRFTAAKFSSGTVSFYQAKFSGGVVDFFQAEFSGGTVSFDDAKFSNGTVSLDDAEFSGGTVTSNGQDFRGWLPLTG